MDVFFLPEVGLNHKVILIPSKPTRFRFCLTIYQKAADVYFNKSNEDLSQSFWIISSWGDSKTTHYPFFGLAQWVQMPNMEEEIKRRGLDEWAKYAKVWVEEFAPEKDKFTVQQTLRQSFRLSVMNRKNSSKK